MAEESVQASLVIVHFSLKALCWKLVWAKLQLVSCHGSWPVSARRLVPWKCKDHEITVDSLSIVFPL